MHMILHDYMARLADERAVNTFENDPEMKLGSDILGQKIFARRWKFDPDLPSFNNEIGARIF